MKKIVVLTADGWYDRVDHIEEPNSPEQMLGARSIGNNIPEPSRTPARWDFDKLEWRYPDTQPCVWDVEKQDWVY